MSEPFVGEIRIFANTWVPYGWLPCNGYKVSVQQFQILYAVIQRTYTAHTTGSSEFNLPNLNYNQVSRAPVGVGMSPGGSIVYVSGQQNGAIGVQLTDAELPAHDHSLNGMLGAGADTVGSPENNSLSRYLPAPPQPVYSTATSPDKLMSGSSLGMFGAGDAHENRQPSLELNFYIAWDGIYPVPA